MTIERADRSYTPIEGTQRGLPPGALELTRGTVLARRYEIRRLVGRGGAGLVMQARDLALREDVAVKLLRPELSADAHWIERLAREVRLARQIRHPNVCRVFDFGQADGHSFLVMELARGSLRDELATQPAAMRTLAARLGDARAVAEGLAAVHDAGIVHRDVTPQNMLRMADGRLVVSDFGLATDSDPTTSILYGGTVAYMAPEIGRGGCASFASDVWALGATIHEIVLGGRPFWREGRHGSEIDAGDARGDGRQLDPVERRIVELCRMCTREPARARPAATEVGRFLASVAERPRTTLRVRTLDSFRRRRPLMLAAAGLALIAGIVGLRQGARRADTSTLFIDFRGAPDDWSRAARVLATFEGRVHAITARPGGQAVRVLWGDPRHTEDVDLATGARTRAAPPPLTARGGPPIGSPDGSSVAFEGYVGGRPFVFLGAAHGGGPVPVTAAADPSMASEPRWLAGSRAFVFDADGRNAGVFSLDTNRATILPAFDGRPFFTMFKAAVHDRVLVARIADDFSSQIAVFAWPSLALAARFDLGAFAVEWQSEDGNRLFGIASDGQGSSEIVAVDASAHGAKRLGYVPGHALSTLTLAGRSLVFASYQFDGNLWLEKDGVGRVVTHDLRAREVTRGGGHVLVTLRQGAQETIAELDEDGHMRGALTSGPVDQTPSILPDGRTWTYLRRGGDAPGLYHCAFGGACKRIVDRILSYATVSPDGARIAYVDPAPHGTRARVVELAARAERDVGDAGSYCGPVWSSATTLWISRRDEGTPLWVEVDVSGQDARPTGRKQRGARDCTDGMPDPAAPVRDGAKIVVTWHSQLRVHPLP